MTAEQLEKLERLEALRKELFALQDRFLGELCGEAGPEDTELQKKFGMVIWELDEEYRALKKETEEADRLAKIKERHT